MKHAVHAVLISGMSKKKAAPLYNVPRGTLQRHIKKAKNGEGVQKQLGRHTILTCDQEEELAQRLVDMEARLYGLTPEDVRRIVYQFCEVNMIKHPFSHQKQMAGRKWLMCFLNATRSWLSDCQREQQ